jgi:hypothetical protein
MLQVGRNRKAERERRGKRVVMVKNCRRERRWHGQIARVCKTRVLKLHVNFFRGIHRHTGFPSSLLQPQNPSFSVFRLSHSMKRREESTESAQRRRSVSAWQRSKGIRSWTQPKRRSDGKKPPTKLPGGLSFFFSPRRLHPAGRERKPPFPAKHVYWRQLQS